MAGRRRVRRGRDLAGRRSAPARSQPIIACGRTGDRPVRACSATLELALGSAAAFASLLGHQTLSPISRDGGRHHQRPDDEGVEQDAEADQERQLREEQQRQHRQRAEGRGQHQPGDGDHPAGHRQRPQDAVLRAVPRPTPRGPGSSGRCCSRSRARRGTRRRSAGCRGRCRGSRRRSSNSSAATPTVAPTLSTTVATSSSGATSERSSRASTSVMTTQDARDDHPQVAGGALAGVEVARRLAAHERLGVGVVRASSAGPATVVDAAGRCRARRRAWRRAGPGRRRRPARAPGRAAAAGEGGDRRRRRRVAAAASATVRPGRPPA